MTVEPGIYIPLHQDGYEFCHPVTTHDLKRLGDQIADTQQQSSWEPVSARISRSDQGRELARSDSPWLASYALIFRPHAVDALGATISENGQLLPLECQGEELFVFKPSRMLDALDEDASSIVRFKAGHIMDIRKHVFRPDVISGVDVFKIPNIRLSRTFLSERFVDTWMASGLQGLTFKKIWSAWSQM
jgi:hypothetical protein